MGDLNFRFAGDMFGVMITGYGCRMKVLLFMVLLFRLAGALSDCDTIGKGRRVFYIKRIVWDTVTVRLDTVYIHTAKGTGDSKNVFLGGEIE